MKTKNKNLIFAIFVFLSLIFVSQSFSQEMVSEEKKKEIIEDIETMELGLFELKACISKAKTSAEIERCREEIKMRRFLEVQDMLLELGMTREERRMKRFMQER